MDRVADRGGFTLRAARILIYILATAALAGCAGVAPVPGGSDTINESFYKDKEDMLARLEGLKPGMPQGLVMQRLGRNEGELQKLRRDEITSALLGSNNIQYERGLENLRSTAIHSLYGYKLVYKNVERDHGFSSPIRVRSSETGFSYTVTMVFHKGRLFEYPMVSGGIVNASNSRTVFDYLNPGMIVSRVTD